jgi:hypothetical protein
MPMEDPDIVVAQSDASVGPVASDPTEARHDVVASASTSDHEQQSAKWLVTGPFPSGGGRQASWTWSVTLISTVGLSGNIVLTTGSPP